MVIGNAMSRGNPAVEYVLERNLPYTSGPAFLADYLLKDRWVLAVAGTHGKSTTSSMLAWILEYAGLNPGFLIGGVPENFGLSARYGDYPFFVVEADEYDTAFFDKRSKFVHYQPRTCVLNNLEFDHADIFDNVGDIKKQFNHLVRTVPGEGKLIVNGGDPNLDDVIAMGCWSPVEKFSVAGEHWSIGSCEEDGRRFDVCVDGEVAAQQVLFQYVAGGGNPGNIECHASVASGCYSGSASMSTAYSMSVHGRPFSLSAVMKGSGSNSSMFQTPGRSHSPVSISMAPIMAGTPVV